MSNGLCNAKAIYRRGLCRSLEAVELDTPRWSDWFNHQDLLEPLGSMGSAEATSLCYPSEEYLDFAASS
jgi:putative transposase